MRRSRGLRTATDIGVVVAVLALNAVWIACVLLIPTLR